MVFKTNGQFLIHTLDGTCYFAGLAHVMIKHFTVILARSQKYFSMSNLIKDTALTSMGRKKDDAAECMVIARFYIILR